MDTKQQKLAIIGGVVIFVLGLTIIFTDIGVKLGKLGTITGNIISNMANAKHGDSRSLDIVTVDYIKKNTGSTVDVEDYQLPKAFRPMKKYKHPPFSMGACQVCHAPKRSKPAAILTKTVWGLCYKCHEPQGNSNKKFKKTDCNKCHNPHHADRKVLLRNKVKEKNCPVGDFQE